MAVSFEAALAACPLIAILRGVHPHEVLAVGRALVEAGVRIIEVPLNSPEPLDSIRMLTTAYGESAVIGAGTVMSEVEVGAVARAGGRLIVSPHLDPEVVRATLARGLVALPGIATPSELFFARRLGAPGVKLFPGELMTPAVVKALRAVVPTGTLLIPVGGISPDTIAAYRAAGADGFGIGTALYAPGRSAAEVGERARAFAAALAGDG